jgi:hypothetical protein
MKKQHREERYERNRIRKMIPDCMKAGVLLSLVMLIFAATGLAQCGGAFDALATAALLHPAHVEGVGVADRVAAN